MWTTLALMTSLTWTPAQAAQLQVKNERVTHGILGQERKENSYLPGDMVVLAFDIEGLKMDDQGQVKYSMGVELKNKKGDSLFNKKPMPMTTVNSLGSSRVPTFALTEIGTDTEPGDYTMTVTVNDEAAGTSTKTQRTFEVKKTQFGIVRAGFYYIDPSERGAGTPPQLAPPLAVPGQAMLVNFAVVGFQPKGDKSNPSVSISMEVQDEAGTAVLKKPFTGKATELEEDLKKLRVIPFNLPININRSGKYKIVITAKDDNANGKTVSQTLNLTVVEVK